MNMRDRFAIRRKQESGFTLVELMITMVISGIIVAAIYTAYLAQQRTYLAQEQVAEMQQNIRAALMMMTRDIRMAGYDPGKSAGSGFDDAQGDGLVFTADLNEDGDVADTGENIGFDIYTPASGVSTLGRSSSSSSLTLTDQGGGHYEVSGHQPLADNIEQLEFYYTLEDGTQTLTPGSASLGDIRSIQISILARAGKPDRKFTNTMTYTPASGTAWDLNGAAAGNAANDNFRRRLMITTVNCRNMGL